MIPLMNKTNLNLRDHLLLSLLPHVPGTGWTWDGVCQAAQNCNIDQTTLENLFPDELCDVVAHFSDYADRLMLERLDQINPTNLRARDRVQTAVETRFQALMPHRDAMRLALAYWSVPPRSLRAARNVWRTADRIWEWAGDTSNDYNRYTKRGLLAGVLTATALVWIKDTTPDLTLTRTFLARRIENVLQFGQILRKTGTANA